MATHLYQDRRRLHLTLADRVTSRNREPFGDRYAA